MGHGNRVAGPYLSLSDPSWHGHVYPSIMVNLRYTAESQLSCFVISMAMAIDVSIKLPKPVPGSLIFSGSRQFQLL